MAKILSADQIRTLNADRDIAALGESLHLVNGIVKSDGAGGLSASSGEAGFDTSALHGNVSAEVSALTEKTALVNADLVVIEDSEDTNAKKKVQIVNIPVIVADDAAAASASNVGKFRYRVSGTISYGEWSMQTGASTYEWVELVRNDWT